MDRIFILSAFILIAWIFEGALSAPRLNITATSVDVKVNSTLYVHCTGQQPLSWGFKDPMNRNKRYHEVKGSESNTIYGTDHFESIMAILFTSCEQTGEYVCYYGSESTSVYVYVDDESNLLLPMPQFPFLTLHAITRSVIPCLPTVSIAEVSLWKIKQPHDERIRLDGPVKYDPTVGFILRSPTEYFKGNFYCLAQFHNRTQKMQVNIYVLPQTQSIPEVFINDSAAKYVLLHSDFTLTCEVKIRLGTFSSPPRWSHPVTNVSRVIIGNQKIKKNRIYKTISETLTVIDSQKTDEGIYQCNVTDHSDRENYDEVEIAIYENPLNPRVNFSQGADIIVQSRGESAYLKVHYTVFPQTSHLRIEWTKSDDRLLLSSHKYIINTSKSELALEILNLTGEDTGVYTVTVHTSGGSYNKSFHLHVKDKPSVIFEKTLACCYIPNESYQLKCHVRGFPSPRLSWFWRAIHLDSEWVIADSNDFQWLGDVDETISFLNVTALKSGFYKCSGENEMGTADEEMRFIVSDIENGLNIEVADKRPLEMDPFSITCKASSDLFSNLQWVRVEKGSNRSLVISEEFLNRSNTSSSISVEMKFDGIRKNQSGIYICNANLALQEGMEHRSVDIDVREIREPYFVNNEWENEITAAPNSILEIECQVDGTPHPNISWHKNGDPLSVNITGAVFEDKFQKLIIGRLVEEDSGQYTCMAQNIAGTIMRNVTLIVTSNGVPASAIKDDSKPMQIWQFVAAGVGATLTFFLLLFFGRCVYKRKYRQMKLQGFDHHLFKEGQMSFYDPNMPLDDQVDLLPYDSRWEFPKENLKFGRTLGQGAFGRVVKAEAIGLNDYETSTTVAVKMLKEKADINQQKALAAELKILIHLGHHVNIVNLMGAVTKNIPQGELLVMVEYCRYGNLRYYLLRHRESFVNDINLYSKRPVFTSESSLENVTGVTEIRFDATTHSSGSSSTVFAVDNPNYRQRLESIVSTNPRGSSTSSPRGRRSVSNYCRVDSQEHVITTADLLCFSFQCACGMEYLASRKLIHRDLAARNVLLADERIVKICDFGLAKDCYKYENYVKKGDGPLPIKWMAIESIRDHVFTTKSDVWSFGILMWEFFTLGNNPYPGIEIDEEFYKRLSAGYRLEKPEYCPDDAYAIMQHCWQENPEERPEFRHISDRLGALLEAGVKQHYIDLNAPYMQMNCKMMEQHEYSNMPMCNGSRVYINVTSVYDSVPPPRSLFIEEIQENVPMNQLKSTEENEGSKSSDYLQMGQS